MVGQEPFVLFFPDDVIVSEVPVAKQMIDVFEQYEGCVVAVERVPREDTASYGVVEVEPVLNMAAGKAHWGLTGWVPPADLRRVAAADPAAVDEAVEAAAGRALIVAFRDAHRSPSTQAFVTAVLAERPDAVLLEMGLPYWIPPAGSYQAHLATYGASRASTEAAAEVLGLARPA